MFESRKGQPILLFSEACRPTLGHTENLIKWYPGLLPGGGGKSARREVVKGVKNEWRCTSTPPICIHGVDRDNFSVLFCLMRSELKIIADIRFGWCVSLLATV